MPLDTAHGARPGDVAGNAELLPLNIAGMIALFSKGFCFVVGDLVVRYEYTAAVPAVLRIEKVDGVERCAGAGEEVEDKG